MVAGDRRPSRITGPIYELRAVVTHYGHHENGHYVCYRRHPASSVSNASRVEGAESESPITTTSEESAIGDAMNPDHEPQSAPDTNGSLSGQDGPLSQWWRLSDEDVTKVDEKTVLSQGGVFMLFYDCVDPNSVLVSEAEKPVNAEDAFQGIVNLNEGPANLVAAQGRRMVQEEDGDSTTDSGETLQLDEVLPFSATPTVPDTSPVIPMVDEGFSDISGIASAQQFSLLDSKASPGRPTAVNWNQNSEQDQETASMCSDTTVVGDEEFPLPRYQMCAT
jgi:ubiquitin carboxyl-terminal hydrolase 1